jgi:glycine cleavage system aminomethyltransferase T
MQADTRAIRQAVAISRPDHITVVRVAGDAAFTALDRLVPREMFLRDGQIFQTMLLKEDATPLADLMVCREDESYVLLAEGIPGPQLVAHLQGQVPGGAAIEIRWLEETHGLISLDGPYAWELLADVLGPDVIGLPYLGFFQLGETTCFRSGKTGEYGYLLLGPRGQMPELWGQLRDRGTRLDVAETDLPALDQCALENFFFNIRREGSLALTPLELQLQWRVSYQKEFFGAAALRARRAQGISARLTTMVSQRPLALGDALFLGDRPVGKIVNAGYSDTRKDHVALGLVDMPWAHPGLPMQAGPGRTGALTVATPVINNRSLYIHPQRHSYRTRNQQPFPPLC